LFQEKDGQVELSGRRDCPLETDLHLRNNQSSDLRCADVFLVPVVEYIIGMNGETGADSPRNPVADAGIEYPVRFDISDEKSGRDGKRLHGTVTFPLDFEPV